MIRTVVGPALALGLLFSLGGAAQAQAPAAETEGVAIARLIFRAISFETLIAQSLTQDGSPFEGFKGRPEWDRYLADAMIEETRHDLPHFEQLVGRSLAQTMSLEELKAGAVILADPAMQAAIKAGAEGREVEVTLRPETERLAETPAGRRFLKALEGIEAQMAPLEDEFVIQVLPGAFRRFADKAEAGEAARHAQGAASSSK